MLNQSRAPLWEALQIHQKQSQANFHVPGHKAGQAFDPDGLSRFSSILPIDLTEVGELDDLHAPTGVIKEAQTYAAELFAADKTRFLVGGTTAGILASILTVCKPNDMILVARHCHQSVFHGCLLASATVVTIPSEFDPVTGLELPLSPQKIKDLLRQYPKVKAVVVTSPTYFGVVQHTADIAKVVHAHRIPLIVDEAHGAHFGFHPSLPDRAMQTGVDVSIQSTHKMLPSLTMSSMIHVQGNKIDSSLLDYHLQMIQSSSPSYLLMASLDLTRRYMALHGYEMLHQLLHRLADFRTTLTQIEAVQEQTISYLMDPLKLSLSCDGYTGHELACYLEKKGIFSELADDKKVLFVFSLGTKQAELDYFVKVVNQLQRNQPKKAAEKILEVLPSRGGEIIPYAECRTRERCMVPVEKAIGKRSAVHLVPYPPGVPYVLMGETIERESIDYLLYLQALGGKIRGFEEQDGQHLVSVYY
jgi:arginine/lysine/ornithine decarboxylase